MVAGIEFAGEIVAIVHLTDNKFKIRMICNKSIKTHAFEFLYYFPEGRPAVRVPILNKGKNTQHFRMSFAKFSGVFFGIVGLKSLFSTSTDTC